VKTGENRSRDFREFYDKNAGTGFCFRNEIPAQDSAEAANDLYFNRGSRDVDRKEFDFRPSGIRPIHPETRNNAEYVFSHSASSNYRRRCVDRGGWVLWSDGKRYIFHATVRPHVKQTQRDGRNEIKTITGTTPSRSAGRATTRVADVRKKRGDG